MKKEFFIEKNGELNHLGSCVGSDTPSYFWNVKNISDWNDAIQQIEKKAAIYKTISENGVDEFDQTLNYGKYVAMLETIEIIKKINSKL